MRPITVGRSFVPKAARSLAAAGLLAAPLIAGCGREPVPQAAVPAAATPAAVLVAATATQAPTKAAPAPAVNSQPSTPSAGVSPAERVEAHLAAGEFGAALKVADAVDAPAERSGLVARVAEAEIGAGEFAAAGKVVNRLAEAQRKSLDEKLAAADLAGGGSQADFSELISLIMTTTNGLWELEDGTGGSLQQYTTGVSVNPLGVMALLSKPEQSARLKDLADGARVADLNADMAKASSLRVVSLTRLERAVADRIENGQDVPASMRQLAGLTRVQYVFLDEETNEVLLAGPAEGWKIDETGAAVGVESGRPVLHLDDFVTVLRTFGPGGLNVFQCLIVPRQEGLKAVQDYAAASNDRGPLRAGGARNFANKLGELLGEQDVVVNGVPVDSRVARVIVEADYRMKLIGIDKLQAAELPSFFDLLTVAKGEEAVATKALRWWMTMNYEAVLHSGDKTAFEFVGPAVKCLSEDEFLTARGERVPTGKAEATNRAFAERFTAGYEALAGEDLVFAELRNVFDLALAAALIRAEGLDARAEWDRGVFAVGGAYEPATYAPARTVETAANHRVYSGTEVVVQVAGGVQADLLGLLKDTSVYRTAIRTGEAVAAVQAATAPETRWWWDVK